MDSCCENSSYHCIHGDRHSRSISPCPYHRHHHHTHRISPYIIPLFCPCPFPFSAVVEQGMTKQSSFSARKATSSKRRSLSDYKRLAVWNTYIGKETYKHPCLVCNDIMMEKSERVYDCGHVDAVANGGTDDIKNLRPVCHQCNIRMGTKNMVKFMEELGLDKQNPEGFRIVKYGKGNEEGRELRRRKTEDDLYKESSSSEDSDSEGSLCKALKKNGEKCNNPAKFDGLCGRHKDI
jgi:Family of unknown function (DUF5763)/HNH endonuclease